MFKYTSYLIYVRKKDIYIWFQQNLHSATADHKKHRCEENVWKKFETQLLSSRYMAGKNVRQNHGYLKTPDYSICFRSILLIFSASHYYGTHQYLPAHCKHAPHIQDPFTVIPDEETQPFLWTPYPTTDIKPGRLNRRGVEDWQPRAPLPLTACAV